MSNVSIVSGGGSNLASSRQAIFKQLDSNGNGKVSKDEFVSARPQGVSESKASDLFSKIDSKGSGEVTQSELDAGTDKYRPGGDGAGLGGAGLGGSGNILSSKTLSSFLGGSSEENLSGNNSSISSNSSSYASLEKLLEAIKAYNKTSE